MSNYKARTTVYEKQANGKMFPLGQVVPNIDERVRKLENFPSAVVVTKPTIDGSLNLPEGGGSIKFAVSAQALLPDSSITKFDYWLDNNPAKTETAALNKATITIETPEGAQEGETFDLYVRAYDNNGSSNVNSVTLTVVAVGVSTPTISGKTEGVVKGEATFTGSAFNLIGGEGNHDKSDWILYKTSADSVEVWSSKNDTSNKTTCPSSINDALESSESYILKLRYHDSTMDLWSEYGSITFTTAGIAVRTPTLSGNTTNVMKGSASFTGSEFQVEGVASSNHDKSDWVLVKSSASTSEIWSSKNDSVNKTTSPKALNNVLEVSTTYTLKVRYHDSVNDIWSGWGSIEFTTNSVFAIIATPTISGPTDITQVNSDQSFEGSAFQMTVGEGSHDKSDWVLYKTGHLDSEIWSSKNDGVNKTTSPATLKDALQVSTSYTLKLRYHDANSDIWSEWGSIEFTTRDSFVKWSLHFRLAESIKQSFYLNLFKQNRFLLEMYDDIQEEEVQSPQYIGVAKYPIDVYVNGEKVALESANNSIVVSDNYMHFKANAGDEVEIVPRNDKDPLPLPSTELTKLIGELLGPLPEFCYWATTSGSSLPTPKQVVDLSSLFANAVLLNKTPLELLPNNQHVTNLQSFFSGCSKLTPIIRVRGSGVTNANNFAAGAKSTGTVYVPRGTTTATTFKSASSSNVNVIEE